MSRGSSAPPDPIPREDHGAGCRCAEKHPAAQFDHLPPRSDEGGVPVSRLSPGVYRMLLGGMFTFRIGSNQPISTEATNPSSPALRALIAVGNLDLLPRAGGLLAPDLAGAVWCGNGRTSVTRTADPTDRKTSTRTTCPLRLSVSFDLETNGGSLLSTRNIVLSRPWFQGQVSSCSVDRFSVSAGGSTTTRGRGSSVGNGVVPPPGSRRSDGEHH